MKLFHGTVVILIYFSRVRQKHCCTFDEACQVIFTSERGAREKMIVCFDCETGVLERSFVAWASTHVVNCMFDGKLICNCGRNRERLVLREI
jgi:hypothetical protein